MTQSNSKNARQTRLEILEEILIVKDPNEKSLRLSDVCEYLEDENAIESISFKDIQGYKIIDLSQFN